MLPASKGLSQIAETPARSTAASRPMFCSLVTISTGTVACQDAALGGELEALLRGLRAAG